MVDGQNIITHNREDYLDESIHTDLFRHGGIGFHEYLLHSYVLNISTRIRTGHLSLF